MIGKIRPPKNLNKLQEKVAFVIWEGERISVFPSSDSLLSGSIKEADRSPVPVGLVPLLLSPDWQEKSSLVVLGWTQLEHELFSTEREPRKTMQNFSFALRFYFHMVFVSWYVEFKYKEHNVPL